MYSFYINIQFYCFLNIFIHFCSAFFMTESAFNFIHQFMFTDDMIKTAFFLHVQNACTEKVFKDKTQMILKWVHDHQLSQNNSILLNEVINK